MAIACREFKPKAIELHQAGLSNRQIAIELEGKVEQSTISRWIKAWKIEQGLLPNPQKEVA